MAKNKTQLLEELKALGVKADPKATNPQLEALLASAKEDNERLTPDVPTEPAPEETPDEPAPEPTPEPEPEPEIEPEPEPRLTDDSEEAPEAKTAEPEDYLRQYQYRKQTKPGSVDSDPQPGTQAVIMKAKLLAQPKVRILIPRPQGEKKNIDLSVNLDGYRLDLPKQTYIDVPEQIADVIMDSQQQTDQAIARQQITGGDKQERLS